MVSLLEAIRAQRDRFIPPTVQQRSTQGTNKAVQQGTTKAQEVVNKDVKGFFDFFPKPADFLLIDRKKQQTAFADMNIKPTDKAKTFTRDLKTNVKTLPKQANKQALTSANKVKAIQSFLNKTGAVADIFKSFGF